MRILAALMATTFLGLMLQIRAQERQDSTGPAVYKVEFDIRDGSDASQPIQHFSMLIDESRRGAFQAANRVSVATGSSQYIDVGVKIECAVHESDGKAALRGDIELTRVTGQVYLSGIFQPIIGQRKLAFDVTALLGSPTVIIDDRNAIAAMHEVQATVTKVN